MNTSPRNATSIAISPASGFGMVELRGHGALRAQILPNGAIHAIRHEDTLINQVLPSPIEDGLFRLLLRWRTADGSGGWAPVAGPRCAFAREGPASAIWMSSPGGLLRCSTVLQMHPRCTGWAWRVQVENVSAAPASVDALIAQDLGLGDEAAVRNNEVYNSQYIDLLPLRDSALGWVILARQNQAMAGGRFPWLAHACAGGASAFCTDGTQFFGADHRLGGEPAAALIAALPSKRLQYECALAGLQSDTREIAPGASAEFVFLARFVADHAAASAVSDLRLLREMLPLDRNDTAPDRRSVPAKQPSPVSLFVGAPWLHGGEPSAADWENWFPGKRRHEERGSGGEILSFFHGADTHVVSRAKEASIQRPHGHILKSGRFDWIDADQFGVTCYASGVFGSQAYLGNPNLGRLLSVARDPLNAMRAAGQRVFVRGRGGAWRQLGVPSAFAMQPDEVRWFYRLEAGSIEARVWCAGDAPASFLSLRVASGANLEFLVAHQLVLGDAEFAHAGEATVFTDEGWVQLLPDARAILRQHEPGACFAIAAADAVSLAALGGDALIHPDEVERGGPCVTLRSRPVSAFDVIMLGTRHGAPALSAAVSAARAALDSANPPRTPAPPLRLGGADPGVSRVDEILPWFAHNAAIHFAAPHGLEQFGGGAWGVRDVCQGSVEWLLASGGFATVRRILSSVFEQQYASHPKDPAVAGCWPQWFMPEPFRFIQQAHSHGDVCLWPLKALCDYVEASNDLGFLRTRIGYTDPVRFVAAGPSEELWEHCDRVVSHCESRSIAGTSLIDYGEGDWDDTLQPADPAMRTRMVSTWTVALACHTFGQLAEVARRAGESARAARLDALLARMSGDFHRFAMPGGTVAGFLLREPGGDFRALLHPSDTTTGIRHRLLPMTRAILAGLFTPAEARRHAALIHRELHFADGVRLMSEPANYDGGIGRLFKRAETAANVGREIGLQYVHAHIRYAEAMARLGEADRLWQALQVVNPVGLAHVVPGAVARQSNVYFTSSDADFADRLEAVARWPELRAGRVPVRGGWRLYSSGPGLYLHKVRSCLLGLRESFGEVVFDPVLPRSLDGLTAETRLLGRPVQLVFSIRSGTFSPSAIRVNGTVLTEVSRDPNPYRSGGLRTSSSVLAALVQSDGNKIEIEL